MEGKGTNSVVRPVLTLSFKHPGSKVGKVKLVPGDILFDCAIILLMGCMKKIIRIQMQVQIQHHVLFMHCANLRNVGVSRATRYRARSTLERKTE